MGIELVLTHEKRGNLKKVIDGAVYNTETAKMICEQSTHEYERSKDADVKKLKQLFRTRSNKYFFYINSVFTTFVQDNDLEVNPVLEEAELTGNEIIPISYELALQFAREVIAISPTSKEEIRKYFPELINNQQEDSEKIQKKIYISQKANWYLEMMLIEKNDTNSSMIERLIINEYQRLYLKGIVNRDPYFEMEE